MNGDNKYGNSFRGIFIFLIFITFGFLSVRELIWERKSKKSALHFTKNEIDVITDIDHRKVLYELKGFTKGNMNYYIQWIPGNVNVYNDNNKYIINVLIKENLVLPIYVDNYVIIKDSLFKEPFVSNFSDSAEQLLDGRDGFSSTVKIHYYKDFLSVYKSN